MRFFSALPPTLLVLVASAITATAETKTLDNGLVIEEVSGPTICDRRTQKEDVLKANYRGTLQSNGKEFDSSYKRNKPIEFKLGVGEVIEGWDQGLLGLCVGQKVKLTVPPALGYGQRGAGSDIPPGATLLFDAEVVEIVGVNTEAKPSKTAEETVTIATAPPEPIEQMADANGAPTDGPKEPAHCNLLGPFALLVQGALGGMALLTLVYKRWREVPKRPWKIFIFDVSKQVLGSVLTHIINLAMSELGSVDMANAAATVAQKAGGHDDHGRTPNPCSYYLLNLAIDVSASTGRVCARC